MIVNRIRLISHLRHFFGNGTRDQLKEGTKKKVTENWINNVLKFQFSPVYSEKKEIDWDQLKSGNKKITFGTILNYEHLFGLFLIISEQY